MHAPNRLSLPLVVPRPYKHIVGVLNHNAGATLMGRAAQGGGKGKRTAAAAIAEALLEPLAEGERVLAEADQPPGGKHVNKRSRG